MYGVTRPMHKPFVDPRCFAFGDSFVLILDSQRFIDRVQAAARKVGLGCEFGPVEYYDEDGYSGDTGPFRKPSRHDYQQEWRFAISSHGMGGRRMRVTLGDLTDIITAVHPLVDINELIDFSEESAREAGLIA